MHAGGAPLIIPAAQDEKSLDRILGSVQGLILSGGPDIHPRRYGEEPAAGLGEVDEALDQMELLAARLAFEKNFPVLGICRGIQVLNVALGGTLYQDISASPASKFRFCGSGFQPRSDRGSARAGLLQEKRLPYQEAHSKRPYNSDCML